jgi:hypothetical protein
VERPFRPVAGVVLLRSGAEAAAQLRNREVAAAHRGLPLARAHQQSRQKAGVQRLFFCGALLVREALGVLPAEAASHLQPVLQARELCWRRTSDHST